MIGFDFWVQLFVLLACLFYAAPRGGMTLGLMGGIGLIIFIFGFGLKLHGWHLLRVPRQGPRQGRKVPGLDC